MKEKKKKKKEQKLEKRVEQPTDGVISFHDDKKKITKLIFLKNRSNFI